MKKTDKEALRFINVGLLLMVSGILILNYLNDINLGWGLGWMVGTFLTRLQIEK